MLVRRMAPEAPIVREPTAEDLKADTYTLQIDQGLVSTAPGLVDPGNQALIIQNTLQSWRFTDRFRLEEDPTHPEFTRIHRGSPFYETEADLDVTLDAVRQAQLQTYALAGTDDPDDCPDPILTKEVDEMARFTVQKGQIPASYLMDLAPKPINVPASWRDIARRVLQLYTEATTMPTVAPSPAMTNPGYPVGQAGMAGKLAATVLGTFKTVPELHDSAVAVASRFNLPAASANAFFLNFRQGPLKKEIAYMVHQGAGLWRPTAYLTHACSRGRQVFMSPFASTIRLRELLRFCQGARQILPGTWHTPIADQRIVDAMYQRMAHRYEGDISGYDQSVTRDLQIALAEEWIAAAPHMKQDIEAWLYYEGRPVIGPNLVWGGRGATLMTSRGVTHSGLRLTAEVGTLITLITLFHAMRSQGVADPVTAWLDGTFLLLVQGDDILLATNRALDEDAWQHSWDELGFKCTLLHGVSFLRKHRLPGVSLVNAGRILQQTLANEHEPVGVGDRYDPLLVLALKSRWGAGPDPRMRHIVRDALSTTRFAQRTGVIDGVDATAWLADPGHNAALTRLLQKLASDPWIERVRRDAPYSPAAAELMQALLDAGLIATTQADTTLNLIVDRVEREWATRSMTARVQLAVDLTSAAQDGVTEATVLKMIA